MQVGFRQGGYFTVQVGFRQGGYFTLQVGLRQGGYFTVQVGLDMVMSISVAHPKYSNAHFKTVSPEVGHPSYATDHVTPFLTRLSGHTLFGWFPIDYLQRLRL